MGIYVNNGTVINNFNPYDFWADCGMVWDELRKHSTWEEEERWRKFYEELQGIIGCIDGEDSCETLRDLDKATICDAVVAMLEQK